MGVDGKACLITVEGSDGAGKSMQIGCAEQYLRSREFDVVITREPGGTALGEALREILLNNAELPISTDAELMMMFAARAQHYNQVIQPALRKGSWVISDRFADASFAYQGARGLPRERIEVLENWTLGGFRPDLTLLLDLPLELGLSRVDSRGDKDRFEMEGLTYKQRVQQIYTERAQREPNRIKVIDASGSVAQVSEQVIKHLQLFIDR